LFPTWCPAGQCLCTFVTQNLKSEQPLFPKVAINIQNRAIDVQNRALTQLTFNPTA